MTDLLVTERTSARAKMSFYGVHHLALNTDDMKMTVDFYVGVLGMQLVHAMKVPPGLGVGPGNGP
jgi:predicted enzyme related to lactoylglutathione lyase